MSRRPAGARPDAAADADVVGEAVARRRTGAVGAEDGETDVRLNGARIGVAGRAWRRRDPGPGAVPEVPEVLADGRARARRRGPARGGTGGIERAARGDARGAVGLKVSRHRRCGACDRDQSQNTERKEDRLLHYNFLLLRGRTSGG